MHLRKLTLWVLEYRLIYRDRLTDTQLGLFCIAGVTATLITAYALVYFKDKVCETKNKLVKAIFYYVTVIMLVLDPIYTASFKEK